jgi:hypothetical protein
MPIVHHESRASLLGGQIDRSYQPYAGGGYHDRQGSVGASAPRKKMKFYKPNSLWTWAFLVLSIVQAGIALGLEGYVDYTYRERSSLLL